MNAPTLAIRTALFLVLVLSAAPISAQNAPTPPRQPESGPGGREAAYEVVQSARTGESPAGAWLFAPERDDVAELPIVVFLHGFSAVYPETYLAWIDHIVLRGAIVIFPDYQSSNPIETDPDLFQPNAAAGIASALEALADGGLGPVNTASLAFVGHSLGGLLALNLAAGAADYGLPPASIVLAAEPGGCLECGGLSVLLGVPVADLSAIPGTALVTIVTGNEDTVVADIAALIAWPQLGHIADKNRTLIELRSDRHGSPPLIADHYAPETGGRSGEVDALDWYGSWTLLDAMMACAYRAELCAILPGESGELDIGVWSDGTSVVAARVLG